MGSMGVRVYVGVRGGGLEGDVSCCDNLYYVFVVVVFINLVCLFIIINLDAFDVALIFLFDFVLFCF